MVTADAQLRIAVVIPCFRVKDHILTVLSQIPPDIWRIYCIDDACPSQSGNVVLAGCSDKRVEVIHRPSNGGVGAATMTGYAKALADGADIVVKLDGDGQMDPTQIPVLIAPIVGGRADYTKGNRFFKLTLLTGMPATRIIGNAALSFLTKLSSGYWNIFDPTNGYTAIHAKVLAHLPLDRIHQRYFFESDMLLQLNLIRAVVKDVPMRAIYGIEKSNLNPIKVLLPFFGLHLRNLCKRIGCNYFLRDFSSASLELVLGTILMLAGVIFGIDAWIDAAAAAQLATPGTVMLATLPIILGLQLLLNALSYDILNIPQDPLHKLLA